MSKKKRSKTKAIPAKNESAKYIFLGLFDVSVYMILTIAYPLLTYLLQLDSTNAKDVKSMVELIVTGLFFVGAFYYDFYTKYETYDGKPWIINVLLCGKLFFGIGFVSILCTLLIYINKEKYAEQVLTAFRFIPMLAFCPLILSGSEFYTRIVRKHKGKLSKVSV